MYIYLLKPLNDDEEVLFLVVIINTIIDIICSSGFCCCNISNIHTLWLTVAERNLMNAGEMIPFIDLVQWH